MSDFKKHIVIILIVAFSFGVYSCEKEVSTSPVEQEIFSNGMIYVQSIPAGSQIYLDGRNTGKTSPDTLFWLDDTVHQLKLKRPLYRDTSMNVETIDNKLVSVNIDYTANPKMRGSISCESIPDSAEIFLNDSSIGRFTPFVISGLLPGEYSVRYRLNNYRDAEASFSVVSNSVVGNSLALEDTSVWVTFTKANSILPDNNLTSLAADKNGNLWVGTFENGLLKFNGSKWIEFNTVNSQIPTNEIKCITVGDENEIWIGTALGVVKFDGITWQIFNTGNSPLPNDVVFVIDFNTDGKTWIGTQHGLAVFDGNNWDVYTTDNSEIPGNLITSFYFEATGGGVWAGTSGNGLGYFRDGLWKKITKFYWVPVHGIPGNTISDIAFEVGTVWVGWLPEPNGGGDGGLTSYNGKANFWSNNYPGLPSRFISCIYIDDQTVKWVGTDEGLVRFLSYGDRKTFRAEFTGLQSNYISDVVKDNIGNIWIATKGGGLTKYKGEISKY